MKKTFCIMALILGLCIPTMLAQNNLDSALVVTEIANETAESDTTGSTTWTFTNGSSAVTANDSVDADMDDLEDFFEAVFEGDCEGLSQNMARLVRLFEKFGWLFALIPILLFFVLPILLVLLIVFSVYKGRKAKYEAYQQMAEKGQEIPQSTLQALNPEDAKLRNDGIRNIFVGIGLAILLGIIMDEIGVGIGVLVFFVGVGKYAVYWLESRDRKKNCK